MRIAIKALALLCLVMFTFGVDWVGDGSSRVAFVKDAQAIIGMPWTPVSYAGVARRTTYRVVATETAVVATEAAAATAATATAAAAAASVPPHSTTVVVTSPPPAPPAASAVPIGTVVQALPAGCRSVVVNGVSYSDCGGTFYKAAFQGNNLVYVTVPSPL